MDLYLCPSCSRRFVSVTAHPTATRHCRACGTRLELKVMSIPGRHDMIEAALHAESLDGPANGAEVGRQDRLGSGP